MKNNIDAIRKQKKMSIRQLALLWGKPYKYTYDLVKRDSLEAVPIGTLAELAGILGVDVVELYGKGE